MGKVKICADSVCDLSDELKSRYGISTVPLYVNKGDETLKDGVEITQKDVFAYYRETGKLCTTAAVNIEDFTEFFKEQLEGYDELVMITISSEFSSCFQNANIAAEDFSNVRVVDSRNLSTGEGLVAVSAAKLAQQGLSADEIVKKLEEIIPKVDATFFVANVEYLHKGGRCSSIAVLGANLLKLKPCIAVQSGKMMVVKKYRGGIEKVIRDYVKDKLESAEVDDDLIFITHTTSESNTSLTAEEIRKYKEFKEISVTDAGCTVACHCGEDTLGILFIRK
ncbi:MAG: DegV family protein [Oscillospiraceae bacterium]|nr:DegV family protein [Oscillospiraceae bacterium]